MRRRLHPLLALLLALLVGVVPFAQAHGVHGQGCAARVHGQPSMAPKGALAHAGHAQHHAMQAMVTPPTQPHATHAHQGDNCHACGGHGCSPDHCGCSHCVAPAAQAPLALALPQVDYQPPRNARLSTPHSDVTPSLLLRPPRA